MKRPRNRKRGANPTITCTDNEWDGISAGSAEAEMSASAWAVHCALTVDPVLGTRRRLVLDEEQRRQISLDVGAHARSLHSDVDAPARLTDDLGALFKHGLKRGPAGAGRTSRLRSFARSSSTSARKRSATALSSASPIPLICDRRYYLPSPKPG